MNLKPVPASSAKSLHTLLQLWNIHFNVSLQLFLYWRPCRPPASWLMQNLILQPVTKLFFSHAFFFLFYRVSLARRVLAADSLVLIQLQGEWSCKKKRLSSSACLRSLFRLLWTAIFTTVIFLLPLLWFSFPFSVASHIFFSRHIRFSTGGKTSFELFFPLMWRLRLKGINRASKWNSISTKRIHTDTHTGYSTNTHIHRTHPRPAALINTETVAVAVCLSAFH